MSEIQAYDDNGYYCLMFVPFDDIELNEIEEHIAEGFINE